MPLPVISIFSVSPAIQRQAGELMLDLNKGQPDTLCADCCDTFSDFVFSANKPPYILLPGQEGLGSVAGLSEKLFIFLSLIPCTLLLSV